MDEKKLDKDINVRSKTELTDEEIAKAILQNIEYSSPITYIDEWGNCKYIMLTDILDLIHRLQEENKRQNEDYIELDLECRELRTQNDKLTEELKNLDWYKVWHKKFQKEIEDLTLELETYRPTKLSGNGQCKCFVCGSVSWTDWFSRYKGKTLCNKCLKEIISTEEKQAEKETVNKILDDLRNIFIEQSSYGCDANQHIGYYDYKVKMGLVIEQIEEYAKEKYGIEYGVEVE